MPLYNYANKQIGVVAIAASFEEDITLERRALVWQVLAGLFSIVLMAGVVVIVIRGVLVAPLAALNERMTALVAGDASRPADPLDSYCEELETLAKSYEQLRRAEEAMKKRRSRARSLMIALLGTIFGLALVLFPLRGRGAEPAADAGRASTKSTDAALKGGAARTKKGAAVAAAVEVTADTAGARRSTDRRRRDGDRCGQGRGG